MQSCKGDLHIEGDEKTNIPPGAFISSQKGSSYVCEKTWVSGDTVSKHRRVVVKETCVECAGARMPCDICGDDASESAVLKNGKQDSKRFFCLSCVKKRHEEGNTKGIVGATLFLRKLERPDDASRYRPAPWSVSSSLVAPTALYQG